MSLPVVITPEASRDAEVINDYLDSERTGYGQVFLLELRKTLDRIGRLPKAYPVLRKGVRAVRLHRFLYIVYYRVHPDRAEVVAILHGHRDASAWQSRL